MMLLWCIWIISVALVKTCEGQDISHLPNFPRESLRIKEEENQKSVEKQVSPPVINQTSHLLDDPSHLLIPDRKPEKEFPKPSENKENVYVIGHGESDNLQNSKTDNISTKVSSPDKTESDKVKTDKDGIIRKSENVKKPHNDDDKDKLKVKKPGSESPISKTEEHISHVTPSHEPPKNDAKSASDPIHGGRIPIPPKHFPYNNSRLINSKDEIMDNTSLPKFPSTTNQTDESSKSNETAPVTSSKTTNGKNQSSEAEDMNKHEKYEGACDVDDDKHVGNKMNAKNCIPVSINKTENGTVIPGSNSTGVDHHPDAEILPGHDISGPYLIPETKGGKQINGTSDHQSVQINTNKVPEKIVESAPELANPKESSLFQITSNGVTIFVISLTTLSVFGYIGLVVWRKVMLRRSGREILINEDEFCEECTDSHEFEMNQPQSRNVII